MKKTDRKTDKKADSDLQKNNAGINWKKLRRAVRKAQDSRRYEHTLGVEYTSAALAMRYGADMEEAQLAGLLHDCAKCLTHEKMLAICEKYGIPVTETERQNPFLLHAKVGGYLAEKKYGVENSEVINAIVCHTTGKAGMTLLEKIVFVADYIEPGRKRAQGLAEIRELAFRDLDAALLRILEGTLEYLKSTSYEIDPQTEETWRYYREQVDAGGMTEKCEKFGK